MIIKKPLAFAVILLFIGVASAPTITANINKASENKISKSHTLTVIDESNCETREDTIIFRKSILLTSPEIQKVGDYFKIHIKEETSQTMKPKKPLLPVVTRVFLFPFKTKIKDVSVCFYGAKEKKISNPICLTPEPLPGICTKMNTITSPFENRERSYDSVLYPEKQYSYHVGAGRYDDKIVNYLSVNLYPVQYDSSDNTVYYWNKADISIRYKLPQKPITLGDEYDLIIIAPLWFSQMLKPLVNHKNNHGIRSKLFTLNEIYWGVHFPAKGRDRAEKVKYFIKHALDEWGIKYVLLVGGRKGGLFKPKWWVPVRYSNLVDFIEYSYLCDLYFADIYDAYGNFSSWDTNHNNVFAEWRTGQRDILDMYPEVYVGRLPCKKPNEVKIMVDKIITYENTAYGEDWFKKFVGVAGDSFPQENDPYYEGELSTEASYGYLDGFEAIYLWTSTGAFTDKQDVIIEVNKGCGFMLFSGHGNPREWCTHPPHNEEIWISAPNTFEMEELKNYEKLPIVLVGGCWNSQFSTGLLNMLKGIIEEGLGYFKKGSLPSGYYSYDWLPKCWSWSMASQSEGGCIAIMGNTGLGYGISGDGYLLGRGRFMEIQFFKSYSEGRDILGKTHSTQLIYYMNEFPPMKDKIDCKIVQELALMGDPSLKIGGYPPNY